MKTIAILSIYIIVTLFIIFIILGGAILSVSALR